MFGGSKDLFLPHEVFRRLGVDGFFSWLMKPGVFRAACKGREKLTIGKLWEKMSEMSEESRYNSLPSMVGLGCVWQLGFWQWNPFRPFILGTWNIHFKMVGYQLDGEPHLYHGKMVVSPFTKIHSGPTDRMKNHPFFQLLRSSDAVLGVLLCDFLCDRWSLKATNK